MERWRADDGEAVRGARSCVWYIEPPSQHLRDHVDNCREEVEGQGHRVLLGSTHLKYTPPPRRIRLSRATQPVPDLPSPAIECLFQSKTLRSIFT
jgi:hypothetical protein